jgi:TonB family protein
MKKPLLITFILFSFVTAKAQDTDTAKRIFTAVEAEPAFPGGIDEFYRYLQANVKYPPDAKKARLQGKVFISFVVERDGSLTNCAILKGVSPDIDAEALRVVNNSPKWKPGIQNGRPVRVQYSIPLNFKLPSEAERHRIDSLNNLPIDQKIFTAVEHEPGFPGGINAFYNFLQHNLHYPEKAKRKNIQGKVFISFVVEKDGSLTNLKISKGVSEDLDAEALRVIQASPNWNPGTQNGRPVRVAYTLPLSFSLQTEDH